MEKSYLFLAEGFEEIEALATVDILRRAGMDVATVAVGPSLSVSGAHGVSVNADLAFDQADFSDAAWLICPGGMPGAANLVQFEPLCALLQAHAAAGGRLAAICASPAVVFAPLGLLNGKRATCYPGFEQACIEAGADMQAQPVVVDGDTITGQGPAAAIPFALAIVRHTLGADAAQQVASGMLICGDI
ncbi:MAG: DJ-1/PfpI family protein [Muribaculaceae bacterium]|nr:DJ-1/PfpI family protein [Muribaculaceae bacterium]